MPQNSYTNADLNRFKRTPARPDETGPITEIMREDAGYRPGTEPSVDALLAQARGTLARGDAFQKKYMQEINAEKQNKQIPLTGGQMARGVGELLFTGFDLGPNASRLEQGMANVLPFLTTGGPGAIKAGVKLAARGGKAALQGIRNIATPKTAASMMKVGPRAEIPYASAQRATNPNQALSVARDVASETGDDVNAILQGSRKSGQQAGFGRDSVSALQNLAGSGPKARQAAAAKRAGVPNQPGVDPHNFTDFGGRTNSGFAPMADDELATMTSKIPLPKSSRYGSEVDELLEGAGLNEADAFEFAGEAVQPGQAFPPAGAIDAQAPSSLKALMQRIMGGEKPPPSPRRPYKPRPRKSRARPVDGAAL